VIDRLLEIRSLHAGYEGVAVVRDLSLHVEAGEVVALLGPNSAGKTTTLRAVSGLVSILDGSINVMGEPVPKLRHAHTVAHRGVMHVPEGRGLLYQMSVRENLLMAPCEGTPDLDRAFELFPALVPLASQRAGLLSGGEQQMLALGRAFIAEPRLLLLDEMSLGLAPVIYEELMPLVRRIADETGAGVLLVEQHTDLALAQADRACVLSHGDLVLVGTAEHLLNNKHLLEAAYLGAESATEGE